MHHRIDLNCPHSNASGGDSEASSRIHSRFRRLGTLLGLACLVVAARFFGAAEPFSSAHSGFVVSGEFVPSDESYRPAVHRADIFLELIELFQKMLDILEGRTPLPDRDPDAPVSDDPVLTDEERDESNEAVDDAVDEGVDDPEERLEASWNYDRTTNFLQFMIDLIEDFRDANGMD